MMNLQGSWVAMPTPFTEDNRIDIEGFKLLIARQIKYGTSQLFILGSAGEVTLLTLDEKKLIVKSVMKKCVIKLSAALIRDTSHTVTHTGIGQKERNSCHVLSTDYQTDV